MKENVFLKVGYTSYLDKRKEKKEGWTSKFIKKIIEHKFLLIVISVIIMCIITNLCLIYKFICIMEKFKIGIVSFY